MSAKAREPRQPAPDAAPAAAGEEPDSEGMDISFSDMAAAYEQQIGQLAGQVLQKDIVIRKLQQQLVAKSKNKPGA